MKKKMLLTTIFLLIGFGISLSVFLITKNDIAQTVTISIGITLYHFAMRLAVGAIVNSIMKNQANHNNAWFCEKSFESKLYKLLRVRKWKKYLPTYNPDTFDVSRKTVKEIVGATCQAEIVHEIIIVMSILPIILIPFWGGAVAIIITSVLAVLFDSLFVILQRYNRPKLVRIMQRFQKIANKESAR
ncbi:MAG: hypothetical protein IKA77_00515 [Clostridia bacterium]|nr:hypothetical protein [Clostridia bacterium]